jgi:glutaconate CoA-transferase subunit B
MVAVAAREIQDGDLVFVGMRLPILAYAVARNAHAPSARGLFEVGLMRDQPAEGFLGTMGDPPNVVGALWATRMSNVMALMAQGSVDLGFIGGAEVDRFGNLNTSYIGEPAYPTVKLPGSGGGADGSPHWRKRNGLLGGGPAAIITTLCVLRFPELGGEAYLASIHPGHTVEEVRSETGWDLKLADDASETPAPNDSELSAIRRFDPEGFWTRSA